MKFHSHPHHYEHLSIVATLYTIWRVSHVSPSDNQSVIRSFLRSVIRVDDDYYDDDVVATTVTFALCHCDCRFKLIAKFYARLQNAMHKSWQ